jgi:hypothetical protein
MNTWTILNLMPPKSGSLLYQSVTDIARTIQTPGVDGATYSIPIRQYRAGQPILTMSDPFLTQSNVIAAPRPVNLTHIKPDTKDGDVWKWSFDIQRELPLNIAATIGYVGSKGTHTGNSIGNYNQAVSPSPDTNTQARRPFQQFYDPAMPQLGIQTLANIRYLDSYGNSFYHGLQAKADKRFGRGLAFGVAYTYSKAHGDGENGGQEGVSFQNPFDRKGSRGRFRFDQTHNFVAHYVWELPGQNLSGPLKYIIGGWQSNGILSIRSGFPFTITGGNLNDGSPTRPDRIADGELENPTRARWYDPLALQRVTCNIPNRLDLCHYGNSGYNILEGPGQRNLDFSLFKNFLITERVKLQFRSEFFNATNTPFFGDPNNIGFATANSIVPDGVRMAESRSLRNPMRIIQFGLKLFF